MESIKKNYPAKHRDEKTKNYIKIFTTTFQRYLWRRQKRKSNSQYKKFINKTEEQNLQFYKVKISLSQY